MFVHDDIRCDPPSFFWLKNEIWMVYMVYEFYKLSIMFENPSTALDEDKRKLKNVWWLHEIVYIRYSN